MYLPAGEVASFSFLIKCKEACAGNGLHSPYVSETYKSQEDGLDSFGRGRTVRVGFRLLSGEDEGSDGNRMVSVGCGVSCLFDRQHAVARESGSDTARQHGLSRMDGYRCGGYGRAGNRVLPRAAHVRPPVFHRHADSIGNRFEDGLIRPHGSGAGSFKGRHGIPEPAGKGNTAIRERPLRAARFPQSVPPVAVQPCGKYGGAA